MKDNGKNTEETTSLDESINVIGIAILLPKYTTWITNRKYKQLDENSIEIEYYDTVLEADCTVSVVKDASPNLPNNKYEETLDETWEARTISNQIVSIKVQHTADNKAVLATWTYDNYNFAILGNIPSKQTDSSAIPLLLSTIRSDTLYPLH